MRMKEDRIDLGSLPPADLVDARLQLHHAADLVSAPARTVLPAAADHGHTNLGWLPPFGALASRDLPGARPIRVALALAALELSLVDDSGLKIDTYPLSGRTLPEARLWLLEKLELLLDRKLPAGFDPPRYDLPPHAVAEGAAFTREPVAAFAELARWFGSADRALAAVVERHPDASEVRCWPHHFDLATLWTAERGEDGAATKTVGVGLSPGDENYPEPYWYVTPWPYPERTEFPELPGGGQWHLAGFTAAILTATRLLESAAGDRHDRVLEFVAAAWSAV
jgi:hypothetical protein